MTLQHGLRFAGELIRALGLEGRSITSITLHARACDIKVRVTEMLRDEDTQELLSIIRRYKLVPADGGQTTDGMKR